MVKFVNEWKESAEGTQAIRLDRLALQNSFYDQTWQASLQ